MRISKITRLLSAASVRSGYRGACVGLAAVLLTSAPFVVRAGSITPASFDATIDVGETIMVDKTVTTDPGGASKVDVFFLADNTGSMGGIIGAVQGFASDLLSDLQGSIADVGFGVGRYLGDPVEGVAPSTAYQLQQAITTSAAPATAEIGNWFASGGGDTPEANFFALHQVATEGDSTDGGIATGQVTGWRTGAQRVVVWFGDAPSHTTTVDRDEVIAALVDNGVIVAAIQSGSFSGGIDGNPEADPDGGQATEIVDATGGTLTDVAGASSEDVRDAILAAIGAATEFLDLSLITDGDTSGLDISFECTSSEGCDDVPGGESRDFKMTITGLSPGTFSFDVIAPGVADAVESDRIVVGGEPPEIPEPGSLALMGLALAGLTFAWRRRSARSTC